MRARTLARTYMEVLKVKLRFLTFLAALCLLVPLTAHATSQSKTVDVLWRQSQLAVPGGIADSSTARAVRSATAHDTSATIDIRQFIIPALEFGDGGSAVDSVSFLRIDLFPTGTGPAVVADTAFFAVQVSNDGVFSWVTCTGTSDFLGASDTPAPDTPAGRVLEQGSSNTFYITLSQISSLGKAFIGNRSSATAPTWQQLYGWPYMRIIVQGDMTGRYDARVTGFIPACAD